MEEVYENKFGDFYIDVDNIKKRNGLVYYWMMDVWLESLGVVNSTINKFKVNCLEEKPTWLNVTAYSQSMGRGRIVDEKTPNEIQYPKPKTPAYITMKFACDY